MQKRKVLLTFDLEEFDIPNEFGANICMEEQLAIGREGMDRIIELLEVHNIPTTIFTTANYALHHAQQVKSLSTAHEIASHTFYHSSFNNQDLKTSKSVLEDITGTEVFGIRMPRMRPVDMSMVYDSGYLYDSSVNPTFIPGKYNNLHLPQKVYVEKDVYRVPCSVSPKLRIPLFWLAFKNLPYSIYKQLAVNTLRNYDCLNLYFHPWEFTDISKYNLPWYVKKVCGDQLLDRLHKLVSDLKREGTFSTINEYLRQEFVRDENTSFQKSVSNKPIF